MVPEICAQFAVLMPKGWRQRVTMVIPPLAAHVRVRGTVMRVSEFLDRTQTLAAMLLQLRLSIVSRLSVALVAVAILAVMANVLLDRGGVLIVHMQVPLRPAATPVSPAPLPVPAADTMILQGAGSGAGLTG